MKQIYAKKWGSELWITNNEKYCGKILTIHAGRMCSLHYHKLKDETFFVLSGDVVMQLDNKIIVVVANDEPIHVPINSQHCFGGLSDAKILEISTQHFEDDSHRIIDSGLSFDRTLAGFKNSIARALNK